MALLVALLICGCSAPIESADPTLTPSPFESVGSTEPAASQIAGQTPPACDDLLTPPPYSSLPPVSGLSVRAIDKARFEISNTTGQTYYFKSFSWQTENDLPCGPGVIAHELATGPVDAGSKVLVDGGSTTGVAVTVSVWLEPCGEGCDRPPSGQYVVPISTIEPPRPGHT